MKALHKSCIYPELYVPKTGASDARWHIRFSCVHPTSGKLQRVKIYDNLNRIANLAQRQERAKELVAFYRRKLKNGWNFFSQNARWEVREVEPEPVEATPPRVTIAQHLFDVLNDEQKRIRRGTFLSYTSQIRVFSAWLKQHGLDGLDVAAFARDHARRFLTSLDLHPTTLNTYLHNLRHFFKLLIERGTVEKNPFDDIKKFPTEKTPSQYYKPAQQRLLLNYLAENDRETWLLVQLIYYCLVRPKEIQGLKVGDFDLEGRKLRVRAEVSKNKKTQYVAIPDEFIETLRAYGLETFDSDHYLFGRGERPGPKPCGKNHFGDRHRAALAADVVKLKGKGNYCLYSWKHTGAISFYQATKDIKALQLQMRHHSLEETDKYLKGLGISDTVTLFQHFPRIGGEAVQTRFAPL